MPTHEQCAEDLVAESLSLIRENIDEDSYHLAVHYDPTVLKFTYEVQVLKDDFVRDTEELHVLAPRVDEPNIWKFSGFDHFPDPIEVKIENPIALARMVRQLMEHI